MKKIYFIICAMLLLVPMLSEGAVVSRPSLGASRVVAGSGSTTIGTSRAQATRFAGNLIGYWSFNGPDFIGTSTPIDKGSVRGNGTLRGFASVPKFVPGKVGQALDFNGSTNSVYVLDSHEPTRITLSAWVRPNIVKGGMYILTKKMVSNSIAQYGIGTHTTDTNKFRAAFYSSSVSSDVCESTGTDGSYVAGEWVFVAATYDGSTCKIYVNGVDVTTVASDLASGNLRNSTARVMIGAESLFTAGSIVPQTGSYFSGAIDEAKIHDRALTADEIMLLYNASK